MPVENNSMEHPGINEHSSASAGEQARSSLSHEAFFADILKRSLPEAAESRAQGAKSEPAGDKSKAWGETPQVVYIDTAKGWVIAPNQADFSEKKEPASPASDMPKAKNWGETPQVVYIDTAKGWVIAPNQENSREKQAPVSPEAKENQQGRDSKNKATDSLEKSFEQCEKVRHEEYMRKLHEDAELSRSKLNAHDKQILDELITAMKMRDEKTIQSELLELGKNYNSVKPVADALGKSLILDDRLANVDMKFVDGQNGHQELSMTWSRLNGNRDGIFSLSAGSTSLTIRSDGLESASRSTFWKNPKTPISTSTALDYLTGSKKEIY